MPGGKGPGPTIEKPDQYEALRRDGMRKEKAVRISNSDPKQMAHNRGGEGRYEEWSKPDRMEKAREVGIKGRSSMDKGELVSALRHG